jgi:uncharacterized membrane protein
MATQWETQTSAEGTPVKAPWTRNSGHASNADGRATTVPNPSGLARSLGWFSIGLGLAEVLAPKQIARLIGTRNHSGLIRAFGMREIVSGIGILTSPQPEGWVWSRVGGDILDLATLGSAMSGPYNNRANTILSTAAVAGVTALDVFCATQLKAADEVPGSSDLERLEANVMVNRSPEECYKFWRNVEELPRFMTYLKSVRDLGEGHSHWVVVTPGDTRLEWDAEIVQDQPGQAISWRSLPGSEVTNSGSVEFEAAPGGRGTIVRVQMDFAGPGQMLAPLSRLAGKHPEQMAYKDLRRFKQVMETGEVITTEGQSAGRSSGATWLDNIAR